MSDTGVPPPLPPLAQRMPTEPMPQQPIPVQPLPNHPPALPYDFAPDDHGHFRRPPGIITAIGIISIVLGGLGLFGGGLSALYGGIFYFVIRQSAAITQAAPVTALPVRTFPPPSVMPGQTVDPNADPVVEERGLDVLGRQMVIAVLAEQRPLAQARRRQLHALLAKAGQDMFPADGAILTSATIRQSITDSGQLPMPSDAGASLGPDYFVIATGRIEVADDRALFQPSDRSQETIRVAAPVWVSSHSMVPGSFAVSQNAAFAVTWVQNLTASRLTQQQMKTLSAEFANPAGLIRPSFPTGTSIQSQIVAVTMQPDGSVMVLTQRGQIIVNPAGIVQFRMIYGTNGHPPITNFRAGPNFSHVSGVATGLIVLEGTISILLSVYLIVIGILTLRQSRIGRRLHVIYAFLKIPLAITCGIAWCWFVSGFFASLPGNGGNASVPMIRIVLLMLLSGVAVIYPIGLLVAFATPSVRRYYNTAQQ